MLVMKDLTTSAAELETLRSEIAELDAVETPTEEQAVRFAAALVEWDEKKAAHDALVVREEKVEKIRQAALDPANIEKGFDVPNMNVKKDPFENVAALRYQDPNSQDMVARAVTGLSEGKVRGVSDAEIQSAVTAVEQISGASLLALAHGSPSYRSAFSEYLMSAGRPAYNAEQAEAVQAARASMGLSGSTGGFTLPTLLDPTLIHTGIATKDPIRSIARVVTGTQNVYNLVSVGNVTTYWTAEATALTEGSPTFAHPQVTAGKLTAWLTASYEIFQDSDLQAQLPGLIAEAFGYAEGTAFITGSGTNAPQGIVTAISATAASTITATTRGQFNSASYVDVMALYGSLSPRYENTSTWVANKQVFNQIRQMSTGSIGSMFWTNLNGPTPAQLLNLPLAPSSDMASVQTSGTVEVILGDFSQFLIYDRLGTAVEFVDQVFNSSGVPLGQRGLVAYKRVGSTVTDLNAFRFLKT
jgi:HK97 family phage major capsid protein